MKKKPLTPAGYRRVLDLFPPGKERGMLALMLAEKIVSELPAQSPSDPPAQQPTASLFRK